MNLQEKTPGEIMNSSEWERCLQSVSLHHRLECTDMHMCVINKTFCVRTAARKPQARDSWITNVHRAKIYCTHVRRGSKKTNKLRITITKHPMWSCDCCRWRCVPEPCFKPPNSPSGCLGRETTAPRRPASRSMHRLSSCALVEGEKWTRIGVFHWWLVLKEYLSQEFSLNAVPEAQTFCAKAAL